MHCIWNNINSFSIRISLLTTMILLEGHLFCQHPWKNSTTEQQRKNGAKGKKVK